MPFRRLFPLLASVAVATLAGCSRGEPEYTETKRIDEVLEPRELAKFLRVAESLPPGPLTAMQHVFGSLPNWDRSRTLPASELIRMERQSLEDRWDVEWLARRRQPPRRLQRALTRERITHEQFVALALSVGAALSRSTLRPERDLAAIVETGEGRWRGLEDDTRPFASLPPEVQYRTLQQAAWLTRAFRAARLREVPPENVDLVEEHRKRLAPHFPAGFLENPFDAILDPLHEYGIPFQELAPERDDAELDWSREDAIIGTDEPGVEDERSHVPDRLPFERSTRSRPPGKGRG